MMTLPTAIVIAGVLIGLGVASFGFAMYKLMLTIAIFRVATNADDAAFLKRQFIDKKVKPPKEEPVMPDLEISSFADNPKAMKNLAKQQTSDNY